MKVKCCSCGKTIKRRRPVSRNMYGVWKAKCIDCQIIEKQAKSYVDKQVARVKRLYHTDPEFREGIIRRARERYFARRRMIIITPREMALLNALNSYPVVTPGNMGTSEQTMNMRIVNVKGEDRIKGAVWLEDWRNRSI